MLIKEVGLRTEKRKDQVKGAPSASAQLLEALCFCFFFFFFFAFILVFSLCEVAFNSFILNQKFILMQSA